MIIYTIGFTQKSAEEFFGLLNEYGVELLLDIRLNNTSQLAGFSKARDLPYFLRELCACEYRHEPKLAPTQDILRNYKKGIISWDEYEKRFIPLMEERGAVEGFAKEYAAYEKICLLCSEHKAEHCHRRLVGEMLVEANPAWELVH